MKIKQMRYRELENKEFSKFELVKNKRSLRPDLHAFILLDRLFPSNLHIICDSEHNFVYLGVTEREFDKIDELHMIELLRCGVRFNYDNDSLYMVV